MSNSLDQYRQLYINQLKQVEGINIQALPLYDQLPTGAKLEIPILFRLLVGDHSLIVKRKPIHICLVLDRSGSMRGQPLESCKKAVKLVMSQLGNEDKGSFVVYDDSVDVIFTRKTLSDYDSVTSLIDSVTDRGWTNISGGLQKAADILNTVENEEAPDHYQKLVFLFSDGEANRGITELDDLGRAGRAGRPCAGLARHKTCFTDTRKSQKDVSLYAIRVQMSSPFYCVPEFQARASRRRRRVP